MEILKDRCVGCGNCIPWCPMGVIYIAEDRLAEVNTDGCVECNNCYRMCPDEGLNPAIVRFLRKTLKAFKLSYNQPIEYCPTAALRPPTLEFPRAIRRQFSDPPKPHESTGYRGRGTEEIKTNDITGRLKDGDVGFVVEVGRPGIGARFSDVEKIAMSLAKVGVHFEIKNPVTSFMINKETGKLREDVLGEKVLSAIIEIKTTLGKVKQVLEALRNVESRIDTVFSVGISSKCGPNGSSPYKEIVEPTGWKLSKQVKINVGFGELSS